MPDTHSKIEAIIAYLLGLIWEQGEALRSSNDSKKRKSHAATIERMAAAVSSLSYDADMVKDWPPDSPDLPAEPATESPEWDAEQQGEGHDYTPEPEEEPEPV